MQVSASSRPILGIAMGVVGAIVGIFAGNPMMGFKLGMMAGSFLFVPKAESQVNRVAPSDIQIPTCEVGIPIPAYWGTFGPVSGNVVYFGNKTRITHEAEQEVGGKGGGASTTNVWYTWEVDFVICLGWGPGTVLRAYAGGKEIKLDKFRILDGTQTTYDAVFSQKTRKPVYKGLMLVVGDAYDLGTSGQFPLFQFEVARKFPIDALGTYHWTTTAPIPVAGGIDSLGDESYLGGGSTTALPQVDIYDAWLKKDDTVPGTIPAAVKRIAVADNFVFLVEWTTNPMKVYKYTRATMAYVETLDLTGTANKIFAISCDEFRLFICYNNVSNAVRIAEYKTSNMSLENTRTITGITAGQEITDLDVDPLYFYVTDTAAAKVWQILRSSLAATSRTIASGTPNGLDIDNNGNVWVANSGTSVYQYSPAWALLNTITLAAFGNASGVAIMPNQHKVAVLAKTGDVGTVVCVSTGELTTAVSVDFEYERTWKIATSTTDIVKLAASSALLAVLETPSSDIFLYGPTGYYRNTITGTFLDADVNELGVYAIPSGSNDVNFYAGGEGAANTRTVSTDVAGDGGFIYAAEYTFGDCKLVGVGKDAVDGNNMMYVIWNNSYAARYVDYFVSYYTLAVNGNVSTATYEGTFPVTPNFVVKSLRASILGYGLLCLGTDGAVYGWSNQSWKWQRVLANIDRLNGIDWTSDSDKFIGCAEGYASIDPTVWVYSGAGIAQKNHTDTGHITEPVACAYYDGRIYVGDKVTGAGNTRILSYICEASPLSSVGEVLPADAGYELLTNTKYGAGLDPALIDKDLSRRANSFCFEHGISIMPMYTGQMTAADLLEDLCAHHNGFISVAAGKIGHRQFVYDPYDDDCTFTEITGKSDNFGDASIGAQWAIFNTIPSNVVEAGGVLTIACAGPVGTYVGLKTASMVYGAFDIQVDFSSFSKTGGTQAGIAGLQFWIDDNNHCFIGKYKYPANDNYLALSKIAGTQDIAPAASADTSGKFRIVRKGQTVYLYYYAAGAWTLLKAWAGFSALGGEARLFEHVENTDITVVCAFDNYKHYESYDAIYPEHIITEITSSDGGKSKKDNPVAISNTGNRDRINQVSIEYSRRSIVTGPAGPAKASDFVDIAENGLNAATLRLPGFRRLSPATFMAYMYLKRALAMTESLSFELGWQSNNLKAGDLAWITYPLKDLDHAPIRIASLEVTPLGTHKITAMREDDIYDVDVYADDIKFTPIEPPPNVDPGDVSNLRLLLMPAELSAPLDYDLDFFYTQPTNDAWAGASVYQAYAETGDYVRKGTTSGAGVLGTVTAVGDSAGTKYIDVRLDGDDTLSSLVALPSFFQNLAYVLDVSTSIAHYIQFETVTLQSLTTWRLTGLTYDTIKVPVDNSYGVIAAGDAMVFYAKRPFTLDIPDADLGVPLWFKVLSVNQASQEQSLAAVTAQTVTVVARNTIPIIGVYTEGSPAALVGDAVHHEISTDLYYRANPLTRDNVVGLKDGFGNIVTRGPGRLMPSRTPGSMYYLGWPTVTEEDRYTGFTYNGAGYGIDDEIFVGQGFRVTSTGKVVVAARIWIVKINDVSYGSKKINLEIRTDDGTGKPSTTILARSEYIPSTDVKYQAYSIPFDTSHTVLFRFFEYVQLAANTTYHLVIRADEPTPPGAPWGGDTLAVPVGSSSIAANVEQTSSLDQGATWNFFGTRYNDTKIALYVADVDDTASANITTTHPFDTATYAPIAGHLPIQRVGVATSESEMLVAINRAWPVVEFQDWKTTYSGILKHNVAILDLLGADKILLLYHFWATTYGDNTQARAYLNDIAGTLYEYDNDVAPFRQMPRAQVWNKADLPLSSRKYIYIDIGTAGTPKAGRITILKEAIAGVPPVTMPQEVFVPIGGTTGQMLAKVSGTDHDVVWADGGVPDGSVTNAKLAPVAAGDFLMIAKDDVVSIDSNAYTKTREFKLARSGTYRIKFELSGSGAAITANGRIYKNGAAVGTEQTVTGTSYVEKSEDISGWAAGDLCQLYIKHTDAGSAYARQRYVRIYEATPVLPYLTV